MLPEMDGRGIVPETVEAGGKLQNFHRKMFQSTGCGGGGRYFLVSVSGEGGGGSL